MPIRHRSGRSDISSDRGCTSPGSCPSTLEAPSNQKSRRRPSNPSDSKESRSLRTDTETQLMEQLHYNLLYRWFVGLGVDDPVWVPTVFTKNRERLLEAEVAHKFLAELLNHKEVRGLLSDEHFSVDSTRVAATANVTSMARRVATTRTLRSPIPRPSSTARAKAKRQSSPTSATR